MGRKGMNLPMPSKSDTDYRAEDDHRTLERAEEVRQDPSRLKAVGRIHLKKTSALKRVGQRLGFPGTLADPGRSLPKRRTSMARASRGR